MAVGAMSIPASCYAWQYGPETDAYITVCAGCGLGVTEDDLSYPTSRGLIHADLPCALMALNNGFEPSAGPAGEYLRAMTGNERGS